MCSSALYSSWLIVNQRARDLKSPLYRLNCLLQYDKCHGFAWDRPSIKLFMIIIIKYDRNPIKTYSTRKCIDCKIVKYGGYKRISFLKSFVKLDLFPKRLSLKPINIFSKWHQVVKRQNRLWPKKSASILKCSYDQIRWETSRTLRVWWRLYNGIHALRTQSYFGIV